MQTREKEMHSIHMILEAKGETNIQEEQEEYMEYTKDDEKVEKRDQVKFPSVPLHATSPLELHSFSQDPFFL